MQIIKKICTLISCDIYVYILKIHINKFFAFIQDKYWFIVNFNQCYLQKPY